MELRLICGAVVAVALTYVLWRVDVDESETEIKEVQAVAKLFDTIETLKKENIRLKDTIAKQSTRPPKIVTVEKPQKPHEYSDITMTDSERDLLEWILALEAGDQPDCGQRAVVEVIFNRVQRGWGKTLTDVIYADGQFETVKYLNKPYAMPTDREKANIDFVLEHGRTILPEDYVFFATYKANGKDFIQIQGHYFGR